MRSGANGIGGSRSFSIPKRNSKTDALYREVNRSALMTARTRAGFPSTATYDPQLLTLSSEQDNADVKRADIVLVRSCARRRPDRGRGVKHPRFLRDASRA